MTNVEQGQDLVVQQQKIHCAWDIQNVLQR